MVEAGVAMFCICLVFKVCDCIRGGTLPFSIDDLVESVEAIPEADVYLARSTDARTL